MILRFSFYSFLILCLSISLLSAQNADRDDIELTRVLGKSKAKELKNNNAVLYEKLQFDGTHGWEIRSVNQKWLQNEQVDQLEVSKVKSGEKLVELLLNGTVSRDPHRSKVYLLKSGRKALLLASAEEQTKAFNNHRKK